MICAHAIARVLKTEKILVGKGGNFLNRQSWPSCRPASPQQDSGSCCSESWRPRPWGHGCRERPARRGSNHRRGVLWFPEPTASCMEGGSRMRNIARNKSLSGLTPCGRDRLILPMRMLGLRPCMSNGRRSSSN